MVILIHIFGFRIFITSIHFINIIAMEFCNKYYIRFFRSMKFLYSFYIYSSCLFIVLIFFTCVFYPIIFMSLFHFYVFLSFLSFSFNFIIMSFCIFVLIFFQSISICSLCLPLFLIVKIFLR